MIGSHPSNPANAAGVFRWVCTKNPFYAISAALVLAGLWVSFGNQTENLDNWLLMGGLAGHTLLLAATALLLVRYLQLWDDARTVMLLVVLLFLATSVTFDSALSADLERGVKFNLIGLGLAVVVTELILLRGTRLRLPALYRLPYYLVLAVFFLYPVFVRSLRAPDGDSQEPLMWALFGFSTAAGVAFLALLPALKRGGDYVRGNGSPWPWPLYPVSLFVVLALAVPGRAVLMCWSLHSLGASQYDRLIFGPYFLVPFGLALTVLCLELGLTLANRGMILFALVAPLLLVGLALIGHSPADPVYRMLRVVTVDFGKFEPYGVVSREPDPVYAEFLGLFRKRLGADPLFLTLGLAGAFYVYAAARRMPLALECLAGICLLLAVVGPNALVDGFREQVEPVLLLVAGVVLTGLGRWQRSPWNLLRGAACLAGAIALAVPLPEVAAPRLRGEIFIHLTLLAMFVLGATFRDANGRTIRRCAAALLLVLSLAAMYPTRPMPPAQPVVYPLCAGVLLAAYGHFLRDGWVLGAATIVLGYWLFKFGWVLYRSLRGLVKGFDYLVMGLAFFAVAVVVSLSKAGVFARWVEARWLPGWVHWFLPKPALPAAPSVEEVPPSEIEDRPE